MTPLDKRIGFIQGRLSPVVDNKIQAFPGTHWREEFSSAREIDISLMEWTIDTQSFLENPLISEGACEEILNLCEKFEISIPSVTCDYYMENPHWVNGQADIQRDLNTIIDGMERIKSTILVIPLVDNSSIKRNSGIDLSFFIEFEKRLIETGIKFAFEVDLDIQSTRDFIDLFPPGCFGINYDIGNSASEGFNTEIEIHEYGDRVINVHVKDRFLKGTTVPLGLGNANIPASIRALKKANYRGNFMLQTARARSNNHADELIRNIDFLIKANSNA